MTDSTTEHTATARRSSLTWWILALAVVPMLGAAGWALLALSRHPENASDRDAAAALLRVAPAVEQTLDSHAEQLARLGAVIARDPKFYAVLTLPSASRANAEYREALEGVLRDFQREADAPVFAVTDPRGKLLGRALEPASGAVDLSDAAFVKTALRGTPGTGYLVERDRVHRVATVPISAGGVLVGTLTLGRPVEAMLGGLKTAMEADLTLTADQSIAATTLVPSPLRKAVAERLSERTLGPIGGVKKTARNAGERRAGAGGTDVAEETPVIAAGGRRHLAVRREIEGPVVGGGSLGYVLTRPLRSDASPLARLERDLLRSAGLGLALALVCGGIVALAVPRDRRARERLVAEEVRVRSERERSRSELLAAVGRRVLDPSETVFTITDLVADGALGELSGPQREGILAIRRASRGLTRLARDLSTVAALERGDLRLSQAPVEVGGLMEQAAALLIPVASDRRQMVELSVEPGLVHPRLDEAIFGRVLEGLALDLVGGAPDATKLVLAARRSGGGIEMVVAGAAREKDTGEVPPDQELAVVMGRLLTAQHGGTFEVLTEEGIEYRIWLPVPASAVASEPTPQGEALQLSEGKGAPLTGGEVAPAGNGTSQPPDPARAA